MLKKYCGLAGVCDLGEVADGEIVGKYPVGRSAAACG